MAQRSVVATQLVAALVFVGSIPCTTCFGEAQKYLIASAPRNNMISYLALPPSGAPATGEQPMRVLIADDLKYPQGIAIDQYRGVLYVADPTLGKLVGYDLTPSGERLKVGGMRTVADGVEARSVAVDGLGNIYFTDEPRQLIMRITARMLRDGNTKAEVVYGGANVTKEVSAPAGIAMDNYFVYWLNKHGGERSGTLVRAPHKPGVNGTGLQPVKLASNAPKCYGVCLSMGNIFYTDETRNLYGIARASTARHNPITISSELAEPRGCAHDGDGTVYVSDKKHNAIYQFASNMQELLPDRQLIKAADLEGAFGVAVYVDMAS